ncbi:MAG: hypothetical protein ACJ8LL_03230 [Candidatus Udaeobacter sp.]
MLLLVALDNDEARMTKERRIVNGESMSASSGYAPGSPEFSIRKPHENPYE